MFSLMFSFFTIIIIFTAFNDFKNKTNIKIAKLESDIENLKIK